MHKKYLKSTNTILIFVIHLIHASTMYEMTNELDPVHGTHLTQISFTLYNKSEYQDFDFRCLALPDYTPALMLVGSLRLYSVMVRQFWTILSPPRTFIKSEQNI